MRTKKRTFEGLGHAIGDIAEMARRPLTMAEMVRGAGDLSAALREKIMLAVTSVNKCRYCSFVHGRIARREGLSAQEVDMLLRGDFDRVEPEEREILLYARHWAETGGKPREDARRKIVEVHGAQRTELFETAMRAIMFGNYFGNGFDALLDRATAGRLGSSTVTD